MCRLFSLYSKLASVECHVVYLNNCYYCVVTIDGFKYVVDIDAFKQTNHCLYFVNMNFDHFNYSYELESGYGIKLSKSIQHNSYLEKCDIIKSLEELEHFIIIHCKESDIIQLDFINNVEELQSLNEIQQVFEVLEEAYSVFVFSDIVIKMYHKLIQLSFRCQMV